ncbi:28960_t:CDS:2, partial [Gigaspora margarita]
QGQYRQYDDSFISAVEYLKNENHKIILNQQFPIHAIAFMTGIYDELQKSNIRIYECSIDATYKTNDLGFELYTFHTEVEGTEYSLSYLLLENNGNCKDRDQIYESAIEEAYKFCRENSLVALWCYLWCEWYNNKRWSLWAQSACTNKIPIFKTTMFIEGHWKMIKRNFLYKFFRPRLDLLAFILTTKVIVHQKRKFQQNQIKYERPDWKKQLKSQWKKLQAHKINMQRNHQLPFLYEPEQTSNQNNVNNLNIYSNNLTIADQFEPELNDCNDLYEKLIVSTKKALELLEEQKAT